jgi:hypothetical protein
MLYKTTSPRPGGIAVALLLLLPVLLLVMALVLFAAEANEAHTGLQVSGDAAALAAAGVLVDDRMLRGRSNEIRQLLEEAREEAANYAADNSVLARPPVLEPNPSNDPNGDFVFANLSSSTSNDLEVVNLGNTSSANLTQINTVRITARRTGAHGDPAWLHGPMLNRLRTNLKVYSTATLDADVIGFLPTGQQALPIAPIALQSDPQGKSKHSWEYQVQAHGGTDQWSYSPGAGRCVQGADGLFEMTVRLPLSRSASPQGNSSGRNGQGQGQSQTTGNAALLQLGTANVSDLANQLTTGVTAEDLTDLGGQLLLNRSNNRLVVPGTPYGPAVNSSGTQRLLAGLRQLQQNGTQRVWPLYSAFTPNSQMPVLSGFVAARVANASLSGDGKYLTFVLQPCKFAVSQALTDPNQRGVGGVNITNLYICKVRLVE